MSEIFRRGNSQLSISDPEVPPAVPVPNELPAPVTLPENAKLLPYEIRPTSVSPGDMYQATAQQEATVTRFCEGIYQWLVVLQMMSNWKSTPLWLSIEPEAPAILMQYDSGHMWYLNATEIIFWDFKQIGFTKPQCEVYKIKRKTDKKNGSEKHSFDSVFKFQSKIMLPDTEVSVYHKIGDSSTFNYEKQETGSVRFKFTKVTIDLELGITEAAKGSAFQYRSPVFKFNYEFEGASIKNYFGPYPQDTVSCTRDTSKRLIEDVRKMITDNKEETIYRFQATVIKHVTPKVRRISSMIELVNIFTGVIFSKSNTLYANLTKVELALAKFLIFILEDHEKVRNILHHLLKNGTVRILNPFHLEKVPKCEAETINYYLNDMEVEDFDDKRRKELVKKVKRMLREENDDY